MIHRGFHIRNCKVGLLALLFWCIVGLVVSQDIGQQSPVLDISKVDSVESLFSYCSFYIDYPSFAKVEDVPLDSFQYLSNSDLQRIWREGINTRYWLRFSITNTSQEVVSNRQLYLGQASRIFLYELENEKITLIEKKGSNYTQGKSLDGVSDKIFDLSIRPDHTVSYLAHISSTFIPKGHELIDPQIIKVGYESVIDIDVRNIQKIGMTYVAALSIILFLLVFSVVVFIQTRERLMAAFGMLCLSFILYYARDMDYLLWAIDIYPPSDEFITRSEPLFRSFINGGFLFFTFSYFKEFKFRNIFKASSIFVFVFGVLSGLWFLLLDRISPTQEFTIVDTGLYVCYLVLTQVNDLLLLSFLWFSRKDYSRFYVLGTALFLIMNYGGLFKDALFPEVLNIPYFGDYCFLLGAVLFTMCMGFLLIRRAQSKEVELIIQRNKSAQLEELNRMKSEFYTNIGHELKTPLSLIKAPLELELNEQVEDSKSKNRLKMVQRNTNRLISLVNDLTDYTRAENAVQSLKIEKVNAARHFAFMFSNFESLAISQKKEFSKSIHIPDSETWYDRNAVETIVNNLLSNAFKFTKEGDTIDAQVTCRDNILSLQIKDSGIGIKEQDVERIFDRFYRAEYHSEIDGLGVGLAFVKNLVLRHKGEIQALSNYGEGTAFKVDLPVTKGSFPADWIVEFTTILNNAEDYTLQNEQEKDSPIILVVEDNADMRDHLSQLFKETFQVVTAQNGKEGIYFAEQVVPDIILTDMMMPVMGGDQMCELIKNDEKISHIPILMLTANATETDKLKMLECGVSDYILKPFNNREIILKVRNQVNYISELRKRFEISNIPNLIETAENTGESKFWIRIEEVLKMHLSESNFTVEEFSKKMLMSRMQLHRKLKALTGLSASAFLRSKRIEASIALLRSGDLSVSEVAYESGFSSPSYYSKIFKEIYGVSPADYS